MFWLSSINNIDIYGRAGIILFMSLPNVTTVTDIGHRAKWKWNFYTPTVSGDEQVCKFWLLSALGSWSFELSMASV